MIGELTILKGKAKNLYFENTSKDFFNDNLQAKAGVLAVGAAAIGSFSTAAVMTSASGRARNRVQIFTCTVKGVQLSGCFEAVMFEEGDKIEFVVEYNPDNPEEAVVYAARDNKRKILSNTPYQSEGEIACKKKSFRFSLGLSFFCSTLILLLAFFAELSQGFEWSTFKIVPIGAVMGGALFLIMMLVSKKQLPHAKKATKVFEVLGYKNPETVDAFDYHLDAQQAWAEKTGEFEVLGHAWINRYQDSDFER